MSPPRRPQSWLTVTVMRPLIFPCWAGSCKSRVEPPATVIRCVGNCDARVPRPVAALPGLAMCGGHMYPGVTEKSDDDVYRWLINRAKGGDVVVLTADPVDTPCDLYNGYIYNLSNVAPRPNSVTTICFTNRSDSLNPKVAELLKSATAVRIILFCHVLLRERSFPTFLCGRCQPSGVPTLAPMHELSPPPVPS